MPNKGMSDSNRPVLALTSGPKPNTITARGKDESKIVSKRLKGQRRHLGSALRGFSERNVRYIGGKTHFIVEMFEDSRSSSWTPTDLFGERVGCNIVSPAPNGYLVEASEESFSLLANKVGDTKTINEKVDISRVKDVAPFDEETVLRGSEVDDVWPADDVASREFHFWLMPFKEEAARKEVVEIFQSSCGDGVGSFGDHAFDDVFGKRKGKGQEEILNELLSAYLKKGSLSFSIKISDRDAFLKLLGSGAVYRIDPSTPIDTNQSPPGQGIEPTPSNYFDEGLPSVLVVDGGHSSHSYEIFKSKSLTPLVSKFDANLEHGNQVISVVCHGHAWNNKLKLPKLNCKFISAQAIAKKGVYKQPSNHQFLNYLRDVAEECHGEAKVWNLSFNAGAKVHVDEISHLGHEISKIAREYNFLPVISIGNVSPLNSESLCPPADCEAALTVSGREAQNGIPDSSCPFSLKGPGPSGMLKPDVSWFSKLRVIGGATVTGTSYSAPLVSSLAAHTFKNINNATPDLVKAILINRAEIESHDSSLGWGTPWSEGELPWICSESSVTFTWTAKLKPGYRYYWTDIQLPASMCENDSLKGEVVFTAVLKPKTSEQSGNNYFSTRLETSLQGVNKKSGSYVSLIKPRKTSKLSQKEKDDLKWNPVRHVRGKLSGRLESRKVRVYARVYARDLYQYEGVETHHDLGEQEASFVLTLFKDGSREKLYNEFVRDMGNSVTSVIDINQDIEYEV